MLPVINVPSVEITLPVSKKKVRIKAFTVKEDKMFMLANESKEDKDKDIFFLMREVLKHAIVSGKGKEKDPLEYTSTDCLAMFIKLCEISKGATMDMRYRCRHRVDGKECGEIVPVDVNVSEYELFSESVKGIDPEKPVELGTGDISFKIEYPTMKLIEGLKDKVDESMTFELLEKCVKTVYQGTNTFDNFTEKEFSEWFGNLPVTNLSKIMEFFNTMPLIRKEFSFVCPKCGKESKIVLRSLEDFFGLGILRQVI
jgi:hypothetical protein